MQNAGSKMPDAWIERHCIHINCFENCGHVFDHNLEMTKCLYAFYAFYLKLIVRIKVSSIERMFRYRFVWIALFFSLSRLKFLSFLESFTWDNRHFPLSNFWIELISIFIFSPFFSYFARISSLERGNFSNIQIQLIHLR